MLLSQSWLMQCGHKLQNCCDADLVSVTESIISETKLDSKQVPQVFVGMDTRPSSPALADACAAGVEAMGGKVVNYGVVTTPQLHYMVWSHNSKSVYAANEEGYYEKIVKSLKTFLALCEPSSSKEVTVDGANGVGALKVKQLQSHLGDMLNVTSVYDGTSGILNHQCGADYVKTTQSAPVGLEMRAGARYASFDGDADRLVYYFLSDDRQFHLLDGDKIATLIASYLKNLLSVGGLSDSIALGLVQTAYANGASTEYISQKLAVPVTCTKTGVKHLHHAALDYDIGVYFEANGHGTVVFSESAAKSIETAAESADPTSECGVAVLKLAAVMELINQIVGDAIADLILVEAILVDQRLTLDQWNQQYTDLPNMLSKVMIADRQLIQTTNAEQSVTSPEGLQEGIDKLVAKIQKGRSFVRPSGTEDIVRVYAEAQTQDQVKQLCFEVASLVYEMCGGVGEKPKML